MENVEQFSNLRSGWMEDGNPDGWRSRAGLHHQLPEPQSPHHLLLPCYRLQRVRNIGALHYGWNCKWSLCQVLLGGKLKFLQNYFAIWEKIIIKVWIKISSWPPVSIFAKRFYLLYFCPELVIEQQAVEPGLLSHCLPGYKAPLEATCCSNCHLVSLKSPQKLVPAGR